MRYLFEWLIHSFLAACFVVLILKVTQPKERPVVYPCNNIGFFNGGRISTNGVLENSVKWENDPPETIQYYDGKEYAIYVPREKARGEK